MRRNWLKCVLCLYRSCSVTFGNIIGRGVVDLLLLLLLLDCEIFCCCEDEDDDDDDDEDNGWGSIWEGRGEGGIEAREDD